jgi:hypothetical protein
MVKKLISRLFGLDVSEKPSRFQAPPPGESDPVMLVEFLTYSLAGSKKEVKVKAHEEGSDLLIQIFCAKSDMGRIIGKKGRTIGAIRQLATDAAARKKQKLKKLDVVEP